MKKLILALSLLVLAACQQQATVQPQALREGGQTYIAILEPTASPTLPARFSERLAALERAHGLSIPAEDRSEALGMVILRGLSPPRRNAWPRTRGCTASPPIGRSGPSPRPSPGGSSGWGPPPPPPRGRGVHLHPGHGY